MKRVRVAAKKRTGGSQNKEKREERRSKENTDLKKENRVLRRQISALRKELNKPPVVEPDDNMVDSTGLIIPDTDIGPKCSKCANTEFSIMTLPSGSTLRICKECKTKVLLTKSEK